VDEFRKTLRRHGRTKRGHPAGLRLAPARARGRRDHGAALRAVVTPLDETAKGAELANPRPLLAETWSTRPGSNRRHPRWQSGSPPAKLLIFHEKAPPGATKGASRAPHGLPRVGTAGLLGSSRLDRLQERGVSGGGNRTRVRLL
jgi:hypothetical protein